MRTRAWGLVAAASLGLAACGGTNSDQEIPNTGEPEVTSDTMGVNGGMYNDMTTGNDVAVSNAM
jgi:hypothetical protein